MLVFSLQRDTLCLTFSCPFLFYLHCRCKFDVWQKLKVKVRIPLCQSVNAVVLYDFKTGDGDFVPIKGDIDADP